MVKFLCMTLVYCPGLTCIQLGWQYHNLIDFQLGVNLDSISLPGICTEVYRMPKPIQAEKYNESKSTTNPVMKTQDILLEIVNKKVKVKSLTKDDFECKCKNRYM